MISNLIALAVPRNFLTHTVRLHQSHMYLILKNQQNLRPAMVDITQKISLSSKINPTTKLLLLIEPF